MYSGRTAFICTFVVVVFFSGPHPAKLRSDLLLSLLSGITPGRAWMLGIEFRVAAWKASALLSVLSGQAFHCLLFLFAVHSEDLVAMMPMTVLATFCE